jgi:hypothetical protein
VGEGQLTEDAADQVPGIGEVQQGQPRHDGGRQSRWKHRPQQGGDHADDEERCDGKSDLTPPVGDHAARFPDRAEKTRSSDRMAKKARNSVTDAWLPLILLLSTT